MGLHLQGGLCSIYKRGCASCEEATISSAENGMHCKHLITNFTLSVEAEEPVLMPSHCALHTCALT